VIRNLLLMPLLKGYQGMVDGGECIELAEWKTVSGIIQKVSLAMYLHYLLLLLLGCILWVNKWWYWWRWWRLFANEGRKQ